ncbi:MAG: Nif3-like dinuclear metal center hexameric protein [Phycisphaerae bacterium]|nr:Nif3-like dinuclear metal center hexameric protein [Phycisphaerae bacterium]
MPESNTVASLVTAMNEIAPSALAESWDNTGLLLGLESDPIQRVLLCIDLVDGVVDEALRREVDAVVAYHPPIFSPLKSLTGSEAGTARILTLARAGIAVHSPHTAADAAPGGVNDWLLGVLGAGEGRAIQPAALLPASERLKIVTFTPHDSVTAVRNALARAGAGRIGDYDHCATEMEVTGTFRGGEGTSPEIGKAGRIERVEERRLEVVCHPSRLADALAALQESHPYEEPPIEVHELEPRPSRGIGAGRIGRLAPGATTRQLVERMRKGIPAGRFAIHDASPRRRHELVGLCAGSGGELLDDSIASGCTVFVTGELKHHDVLRAASQGCSVILAGHTNTERGWLKVLQRRLRKSLPDVAFDLSRSDRDPLQLA